MSCNDFFRSTLITLAVLLVASSAQAVYVDFADYEGQQSGNHASIVAPDGTNLEISAAPSDFDLAITSAGLGVQCNRSFWTCLTNQSNQIDAEWGEQITITFDEVTIVNSVDLGLLFNGEIAVIGNTSIVGENSYFTSNGDTTIDLGGISVTELTFSAQSLFSDFSIRGIDFTAGGGSACSATAASGLA